jgi:hypothetical protein
MDVETVLRRPADGCDAESIVCPPDSSPDSLLRLPMLLKAPELHLHLLGFPVHMHATLSVGRAYIAPEER